MTTTVTTPITTNNDCIGARYLRLNLPLNENKRTSVRMTVMVVLEDFMTYQVMSFFKSIIESKG